MNIRGAVAKRKPAWLCAALVYPLMQREQETAPASRTPGDVVRGLRLLASLVVVAAVAMGATSASALDSRTVIRVVYTVDSNEVVGSGGGGAYMRVKVGRLLNTKAQLGKQTGALVGRAVLVTTRLSRRLSDAVVTVHFPNGSITMGKTARTRSKTWRLPVLAGTWDYNDARGTVTIRRLNWRSRLLILKLRPSTFGIAGPAGSQCEQGPQGPAGPAGVQGRPGVAGLERVVASSPSTPQSASPFPSRARRESRRSAAERSSQSRAGVRSTTTSRSRSQSRPSTGAATRTDGLLKPPRPTG